jgi:hypothetical protein
VVDVEGPQIGESGVELELRPGGYDELAGVAQDRSVVGLAAQAAADRQDALIARTRMINPA